MQVIRVLILIKNYYMHERNYCHRSITLYTVKNNCVCLVRVTHVGGIHIFIYTLMLIMMSIIPTVIGDCKADVIFVLDSSGSIGFMNWFHVKQFVMDVVQGLKVRQLRFLSKQIVMLSY